MTRGTWTYSISFCVAALVAALANAEGPAQPRDRNHLPRPVFKVAQKLADASAAQVPAAAPVATETETPPAATEHPLEPALKIAKASQATIQANIKDYSC